MFAKISCRHLYEINCNLSLKCWGPDKIATSLQTTLSISFSSMKLSFDSNFTETCSIPLTISEHCWDNGLAPNRWQCIIGTHDDVIKWKYFPRYWSFRSPVNSPHKCSDAKLWCFFYLRLNDWVNNRNAGDLRRERAHYDGTVMQCWPCVVTHICVTRPQWVY